MITARLIGDDRVIARLERMRPAIMDRVQKALSRLLFDLQRHVMEDKLSGQVLNVGAKGPHLRDSIRVAGPKSDGASFIGSVGTNMVYAGIHEYGGRTPAHIIAPKNKKALAFEIGGETIIRRLVHHPGSQMPERSFLRSALRDMQGQIQDGIGAAVAEGLKNA
jgi:phage gpG-like protein